MNYREELLELRKSTGMNRREFCEYFKIPYRTVQDWEAGKREMPSYLFRLMKYKIEMEHLVRKSSGIFDKNKCKLVKNVEGVENERKKDESKN